MSSFLESIKQGLNEAIEYERGIPKIAFICHKHISRMSKNQRKRFSAAVNVSVRQYNLPNVIVDKIIVSPLRTYTAKEIKEIRTHQNMTQRLFAEALGVSVKTVEAWETGTNTPSGIANRMLELLKQDSSLFERYSIVARAQC